MITATKKQLTQWAMEYALTEGCQASRVTLYTGNCSTYEVRNGQIERLQQSTENSLMIHLFVDGRFGSFSTNRIDQQELKGFIRDGVAMTRFLEEDTAYCLPDTTLYYKGGGTDLQLTDPSFEDIRPDDKIALAVQVCEEMTGRDNRILSTNSSFGDEKDFKYMVDSNGFEGEASGTTFNLAASLSIRGEGDARPEAYYYDSSIFFDSLIKQGLGTKALERALCKIGQRKVASGKYPMVIDNMTASRLLSPMIDVLYGNAIQQKNSFLTDSINQQVASTKLTLIDEPHLIGASGARYFDGEGIATTRRQIFEQGVLRAFFIDTYTAHKMGIQQTVAGPSVLTMQMDDKNTDELIASLDRGIFVTGFNGGNCNSTTGDFSYGIEGFLIDKGELTQPISEMNITGNMLSLWSHLVAVGNDPRTISSWRIPSLLFDEVAFSGF